MEKKSPEYPAVGTRAPEFAAVVVGGEYEGGSEVTLGMLAGRVVVVLTSAELSVYGDNRTLRRYVHERRGAAMAFVAPSLRAGESCTDTRTLQGDWQSADDAGS